MYPVETIQGQRGKKGRTEAVLTGLVPQSHKSAVSLEHPPPKVVYLMLRSMSASNSACLSAAATLED